MMSKTNDSTTVSTVAETAIGNGTALEGAQLDAVAGGWAANPKEATVLWSAIRNRTKAISP